MTHTRSWRLFFALALLAVFSLGAPACAGAQQSGRYGARRPRPEGPPNLHGEALNLLPPNALAWARVDSHAVRASRHYQEALALADQSLADELRALERELGVDLVRESEVFAVALYERPGVRGRGWPVLMVRGALDMRRVLASAAARAEPGDPLTERTVDGVLLHSTRARTYYVAAPDVLFLFDTALTGRVLEQLAGAHPRGLTADRRFYGLWEQAGGVDAPVRVAVDAVALRDAAGLAFESPGTHTSRVRQFVARATLTDGLDVRIAGTAETPADATALVGEIDAIRAQLLGRLDVRLLGFTRLLQQGLTAVSEGTLVRVSLNARDEEVGRVLRASALISALTGR